MKERDGHFDDPLHARRWPRERLAAAVLGLLTDEEEEELRGHSDDCPTCKETLERYSTVTRTALADNLGHIPSHILWDWETRGPGLSGLQRELILAHLKRCDECREVLVCMGQDPESIHGVLGNDLILTNHMLQNAHLARESIHTPLHFQKYSWFDT